LRIGLVDRVVSHDRLMEEARALAGAILRGAPPAVARCLEAVREGASLDLAEAQGLEARLFGECFGTKDMKEGTQAFLEKREARFEGR
jgi:enoyl-CoA hydratase